MNVEKPLKSALKVQQGIPQPESINSELVKRIGANSPNSYDDQYFIKGVLNGDRKVLAQAITLIESAKPAHRKQSESIIEACLPHSGKSIRIGITGVPGAGKSTFIEAFGKLLTSTGHQVAVLAIDPSSTRNRGSILGDKTRMEALSIDSNAFIRPSPSSGSLGGVARKTRETISLCEAAGFDIILVETVGVGQSETAVHSMVDFFLLLMLAGAGDELQGIKRGIIEMSDAIIINKADGDNLQKAKLSCVQYANALHLFPLPESGWTPVADICSSTEGAGIEQVWNYIQQYISLTTENQFFLLKRNQQEWFRLQEQIEGKIKQLFYEDDGIKAELQQAKTSLVNNEKSAYQLADEMISRWLAK